MTEAAATGRRPARRRVYVAGVGAISPLGADWPSTVARLAAGETAVAKVTAFDVEGFPSQVAAAVPETFGDIEDRRLALAWIAARQAWKPALARGIAPARIGVFIGAESGRATLATIMALAHAAGGGKRFDHAAFGIGARKLAERIDASVVSPAAVASVLAGEIGARGPAPTVSLACSSSSVAVCEAVRALRLGQCDAALAGGVGADVDPLMLVGFGKLSALSARGASRPFDVRRDGFVVGEGAAMIALTVRESDSDHPDGRVAITGIGRSLDAHHLTAPDPDGDGAARAMRAALADAGRERVGYVQAHGTSTPLNDAIEARAIRRVPGPGGDDDGGGDGSDGGDDGDAGPYVSSVKGAVGHWIAGAGAMGLLCAIAAVRGIILPTAGLAEPDPACRARHVIGRAVRESVDAAMVNAFAFGGANASIVVERVDTSAEGAS